MVSTISDAVRLLDSDITDNPYALMTLLSKLAEMTDPENNDSNRVALIPHMSTIIVIMRIHGSNTRVIVKGIMLVRYTCRNKDVQTSMTAHIDDIVALVEQCRRCAEVTA